MIDKCVMCLIIFLLERYMNYTKQMSFFRIYKALKKKNVVLQEIQPALKFVKLNFNETCGSAEHFSLALKYEHRALGFTRYRVLIAKNDVEVDSLDTSNKRKKKHGNSYVKKKKNNPYVCTR